VSDVRETIISWAIRYKNGWVNVSRSVGLAGEEGSRGVEWMLDVDTEENEERPSDQYIRVSTQAQSTSLDHQYTKKRCTAEKRSGVGCRISAASPSLFSYAPTREASDLVK
jgi:hypothetical protein